jgi:nuclear pore complex protein Nup160
MCESNEVGRLTQFGFVGFQDEVEKTLRFKARNSDPLRFPNYYKVLYSWHIFRGDYRSGERIRKGANRRADETAAGSTMYDQARSLGHNLDKPGQYASVAAMQARSYLSAINALSLVEKRNAWVAVPKIGTEGDRVSLLCRLCDVEG